MDESNKTWILMARVLSDEASPEEQAELTKFLNENAEWKKQYESLEKIWQLKNKAANEASSSLTGHHQRLQRILKKGEEQRTDIDRVPVIDLPEKSGHSIFTYLKYLAAAIVLSASVWFSLEKKGSGENNVRAKAQTTTVKNGYLTKIILPDGTLVWLNAGSKLVYPDHFNGSVRNVNLVGEAFFDVVKDKHHPFIVTTNNLSLKVLGTAFNVSAYDNDKTSEATLIRGKIEVTLIKNPDKKIILKPTEKLTIKNSYSNKGAQESLSTSQSEKIPLITLSNIHQSILDTLPSEALWIENRLVFDEETFEAIAHKIERRYNVSVVFKNDDIKKVTFTGKFKNESLNKVLRSMQTIEGFHFNIKNDLVVIY